MGLADVQQKQTINWKAFLVAVLAAILGSAGSTILAVYFAQVALGLIISALCAIIGIYAGMKIQRSELIKSMRATGAGSGSAKATVIVSQKATGIGRGTGTPKAVPHEPECAAYERNCQPLGENTLSSAEPNRA